MADLFNIIKFGGGIINGSRNLGDSLFNGIADSAVNSLNETFNPFYGMDQDVNTNWNGKTKKEWLKSIDELKEKAAAAGDTELVDNLNSRFKNKLGNLPGSESLMNTNMTPDEFMRYYSEMEKYNVLPADSTGQIGKSLSLSGDMNSLNNSKISGSVSLKPGSQMDDMLQKAIKDYEKDTGLSGDFLKPQTTHYFGSAVDSLTLGVTGNPLKNLTAGAGNLFTGDIKDVASSALGQEHTYDVKSIKFLQEKGYLAKNDEILEKTKNSKEAQKLVNAVENPEYSFTGNALVDKFLNFALKGLKGIVNYVADNGMDAIYGIAKEFNLVQTPATSATPEKDAASSEKGTEQEKETDKSSGRGIGPANTKADSKTPTVGDINRSFPETHPMSGFGAFLKAEEDKINMKDTSAKQIDLSNDGTMIPDMKPPTDISSLTSLYGVEMANGKPATEFYRETFQKYVDTLSANDLADVVNFAGLNDKKTADAPENTMDVMTAFAGCKQSMDMFSEEQKSFFTQYPGLNEESIHMVRNAMTLFASDNKNGSLSDALSNELEKQGAPEKTIQTIIESLSKTMDLDIPVKEMSINDYQQINEQLAQNGYDTILSSSIDDMMGVETDLEDFSLSLLTVVPPPGEDNSIAAFEKVFNDHVSEIQEAVRNEESMTQEANFGRSEPEKVAGTQVQAEQEKPKEQAPLTQENTPDKQEQAQQKPQKKAPEQKPSEQQEAGTKSEQKPKKSAEHKSKENNGRTEPEKTAGTQAKTGKDASHTHENARPKKSGQSAEKKRSTKSLSGNKPKISKEAKQAAKETAQGYTKKGTLSPSHDAKQAGSAAKEAVKEATKKAVEQIR